MKNYYTTGIAMTFFFTLSLALSEPATAAAAAEEPISVIKEKHGKKNPSKKAGMSLNNTSVKIYPDIIKRIMHVVAKEKAGKEIDFSVFNEEGTLMMNFRMKAGKHEKITGLARGIYTYRVFNNQEETASGKFEIR